MDLRQEPAASSESISYRVSCNRREFLRLAIGAAVSGGYTAAGQRGKAEALRDRKVVVVTFGGGARDDETFIPDGQENIPHLLHDLLPRATFYSRVINRGILGHYVATASLATGVYETFNNFADVPPENPTVFEYYRKELNRPLTDAWVIAPSNGFNRIGESGHASYGKGFGAGVILPKRLLAATLNGDEKYNYEHLLRDNYESPMIAPELTANDPQIHRMAEMMKLSVSDFAAHARSLASPDELSVYVAKQLIRTHAPGLLWITLHDIDIAHSGAFSLYIEGIRRTDRLCAEIWQTIQRDPEYAGKTTLYILPDFGRDSDSDAGGNGFQHHRTGDALSRTTWLIAIGPGIRENVVVDRPVDSLDLVPTLAARLGFSAHFSKGRALAELT